MEQAARGSYICLDMRSGYSLLLVLGCHILDRDNPVDPVVTHGVRGEGAGLSLIDSLVSQLSGPGMVTVVKPLEYTSPVATLTIGDSELDESATG